jgi:hypothetical protein
VRRRRHTFSTWTDAEADMPMKLVAWVGRRIHCYMRRRIHACLMRRRICACHMRRRIHAETIVI